MIIIHESESIKLIKYELMNYDMNIIDGDELYHRIKELTQEAQQKNDKLQKTIIEADKD